MTSRWRRPLVLAVLAGLHLAVAVSWIGQRVPRPEQPPRVVAITYVLAPKSPVPLATQPKSSLPQRQRPAATLPVRPARAAVQPQPITLPAMPQPITPPSNSDPLYATPAAAGSDSLRQAIKSAGSIDRQLRKESGNPRDKVITNSQTALAAKIAGAYVGSDGARLEETESADGQRVTRIRGLGGTILCARRESNALGVDPIRDGGKTKVTTCP